MGIDDIQLSPELIAALYPEILISGRDSGSTDQFRRQPAGTASEISAPFLVWVRTSVRSFGFLTTPDAEFMPENQLAFLGKILAACKCSLDDIALVNTYRQPVQLDKLKTSSAQNHFFMGNACQPTVPVSRTFRI